MTPFRRIFCTLRNCMIGRTESRREKDKNHYPLQELGSSQAQLIISYLSRKKCKRGDNTPQNTKSMWKNWASLNTRLISILKKLWKRGFVKILLHWASSRTSINRTYCKNPFRLMNCSLLCFVLVKLNLVSNWMREWPEMFHLSSWCAEKKDLGIYNFVSVKINSLFYWNSRNGLFKV